MAPHAVQQGVRHLGGDPDDLFRVLQGQPLALGEVRSFAEAGHVQDFGPLVPPRIPLDALRSVQKGHLSSALRACK